MELFSTPRVGVLFITAGIVAGRFATKRFVRAYGLELHALTSGELRDRAFALAEKAGIKLNQLFVLPTGTIRMANAFAHAARNIYLTDYLLKNLDDEVLPGSLAGFARQPSPVPQIGVYGSGLTTFAVLTFRRGVGGQLLGDALDAGATPLTYNEGTGAVASAPLVNLVLVHPYRSPDTFLLVGLVNKTALERAGAVLAAKPDQDQ